MSKLSRKITWILVMSTFAIILSSCSGAAAEPTQDPNVVFTQVAETVMVSMAQTEEAMPPTATPEPTATEEPTQVPTATLDPNQATATPRYQQPLGPTPTTQRFGDAAKWNTQSPVDGTVLDRSENFAFHVCLGNIGSTDWTTGYYLQFVDGQQLWWDTTRFYIGETVEPGGKWCFDLPSIAPDKNGEYTTRWYMKDADGNSFYEVYFHYYVGGKPE